MKIIRYILITFLFTCTMLNAENVPWQNPTINQINREPTTAHFVPCTNEANALAQQAFPAS